MSYLKKNGEASLTGIATCNYGSQIVAAIEHENINGVQFHPEKAKQMLRLLENFCKKSNDQKRLIFTLLFDSKNKVFNLSRNFRLQR